jgi:tetratricopeptide (TPR) repeat protein
MRSNMVLGVVLVFVLAGVTPGAGQMSIPAAPDFGALEGPSSSTILRCNGSDAAAAIAACTTIIQSRQANAQMRSAAFVNRGRAHYALGQEDRAINDLDAAAKADPKSSRALANRGAFYQAQGDLDRALQDYSGAIAVNPRGHRGLQSARQCSHAQRRL